MQKSFQKAMASIAVALLFVSCSGSDDTIINNITGAGNLRVEFDNAYNGDDLILGSQTYTTSGNETLKIETAKYIISNIELTDANGNTFVYPKSDSYFIVDESNPSSLFLNLTNIPAGNYNSIKFGIGIDQEQWEMGAEGQGTILPLAQDADLFWSWTAGYKFLAFEGQFTSATVPDETLFMVHTGKTGTDYNYTAVSLALPAAALVRPEITPEIHVVADLSKIIDGSNKISLSEGAMVMGGAKLARITENLKQMFSVAHVHND